MNTWKKAEPLEQNTIPREVATEMLVSPKAKLTNRFRKNCAIARQTVFQSVTPLRRNGQFLEVNESAPLPRSEDNVERILAAKFMTLPLSKLHQISKRATRRRVAVQYAYEKLVNSTDPLVFSTDPRVAKLKDMLNQKAAAFDLLSDVSNAIIVNRGYLARQRL